MVDARHVSCHCMSRPLVVVMDEEEEDGLDPFGPLTLATRAAAAVQRDGLGFDPATMLVVVVKNDHQ